MKEVRYFYAPDAATAQELPDEEARHALRVLRLKEGDEMMLMDGQGNYYRAEVILSFLDCKFSERRVIKIPRAEKIVVAATKQSRKAWVTQLNDMQSFVDFIRLPRTCRKYIAHCYEEVPRSYLFDELCNPTDTNDVLVLVGPEGDFSIDEVRRAVDNGFVSVHLGKSRLRTETAGLAAIMMMQLSKEQ